jgi:hypothetical protein
LPPRYQIVVDELPVWGMVGEVSGAADADNGRPPPPVSQHAVALSAIFFFYFFRAKKFAPFFWFYSSVRHIFMDLNLIPSRAYLTILQMMLRRPLPSESTASTPTATSTLLTMATAS